MTALMPLRIVQRRGSNGFGKQSPATLNTHYYLDYKSKFLSYYRLYRHNATLADEMSEGPQYIRVNDSIKTPSRRLGDLGLMHSVTISTSCSHRIHDGSRIVYHGERACGYFQGMNYNVF